MSTYQKVQRRTDRQILGRVVNIDPRQPRVFQGQSLHEDEMRALLDAIGAGFDDSKLQEIVDPATGKFYVIPGISAAGGTDVPRP